jgi:AraC-like DNA-binding protein
MQESRQSRTGKISCISSITSLKHECSDRRVRAGIDYLAAHDLKRKFRIDQLSRHLNLSTTRVHHLFHEAFGLSPGQIFKLRRMQEAKELLASTFMSVKEVMAAVGLNDLSHFVRDFKRTFGKSPSALRKEMEDMSLSNEDRRGMEGGFRKAS